jgi:hypothetical protein
MDFTTNGLDATAGQPLPSKLKGLSYTSTTAHC